MDTTVLIKATVLLCVALAGVRLCRRAAATTQHHLWTLIFSALLLLPVLASMLPAVPLPVPMPEAWTPAPAGTAASTHAGAVEPSAIGAPDAPAAARTTTTASSWPSATVILGAGAAIGSGAAAIMVLVSLWRVRRLGQGAVDVTDSGWLEAADDIGRRLGLHQRPRLAITPQVWVPMAGGIWQPVVFVPAAASSWDDECRDIVLAHELAHIARRDPLRHVITRLVVAVYWFHPLAWLAARRARAVQEQACDEAVLALGTRPSVYARVLMELAHSPMSRRPLAALPMAERPFLEARIMAILDADPVSSRRRRIILPAAAVALLTLSLAVAQPVLTAQRGDASVPALPTAPAPPAVPVAPVPPTPVQAPFPAEYPIAVLEHFTAHLRTAGYDTSGHEAALRAEMAALVSQASALEGEFAAVLSQEQALRSELAAAQGAVEAEQQAATAERDKASAAMMAERAANLAVNARDAMHEAQLNEMIKASRELVDAGSSVAELKRSLEQLNIDGRLAALERDLAELQRNGRAAIQEQLRELERAMRQMMLDAR